MLTYPAFRLPLVFSYLSRLRGPASARVRVSAVLPDLQGSIMLRRQVRWVHCTGVLCVVKVRCFRLRVGVDFPCEEDELTATERSLQGSESVA